MIRRMFRRAISGEDIPDEWTQVYITSIFKKGHRKNARITGELVSVLIGRLYGKLVKNKVERCIATKIGDQVRFTADISCIYHICTLQQQIEKKTAKKLLIWPS